MTVNRRTLLLGLAACVAGASGGEVHPPEPALTAESDLTHLDGRTSRYRMLAPRGRRTWPVVLFSHGANSSNSDYDRLWRPWSDRGYLVIGANHLDCGPPSSQPKVSHGELLRTRVADAGLPLVRREPLDAFAAGHGARIDWRNVCAAGHSFGAVVAQALAGARLLDPDGHGAFDGRNDRVRACVAMSPPGPLEGFIPTDAWASVHVPCLLQTGDRDTLPGFVDDWHRRLTGFAGRADRWTLIGHGVDHYFGGLICRRTPGAQADLQALEETADLTGEFMDGYLLGKASDVRALQRRAARRDDGVVTFAAA